MPSHLEQQSWILAALADHELRLLRYALRLVGDEHAARDVVQHAFLRLCEESPADFAAGPAQWLFTVVRHRAMDLLRRRKTQAGDDEPGDHDPSGQVSEDP